MKTWAVGLTTAPAPRAHAGALSGEPGRRRLGLAHCICRTGSGAARARSPLELVRRAAPLGVIGNWLLGLSELLVREPAADAYLMVQDDVVFCRNVRGYLERTLWPAQRVGLASVYRPGVYGSPQAGLAPVDVGRGLMGALTYVFPPPAARQLAALGGAGLALARLPRRPTAAGLARGPLASPGGACGLLLLAVAGPAHRPHVHGLARRSGDRPAAGLRLSGRGL